MKVGWGGGVFDVDMFLDQWCQQGEGGLMSVMHERPCSLCVLAGHRNGRIIHILEQITYPFRDNACWD